MTENVLKCCITLGCPYKLLSLHCHDIIRATKKKKDRAEEKGDFKQLNLKGKEKIEVNGWQDMYENMSAEQYQWWGREKISCCHSVFPVDIGMESS